jgi:hypothetical protein
MVSRISEPVLNCADPNLLAGFWCKVHGYVELDREDGAIEIGPPDAGFGGLQPTIILSPGSNPRTGRLPLHIDVNPVDSHIGTNGGDSPHAPGHVGPRKPANWALVQDATGSVSAAGTMGGGPRT